MFKNKKFFIVLSSTMLALVISAAALFSPSTAASFSAPSPYSARGRRTVRYASSTARFSFPALSARKSCGISPRFSRKTPTGSSHRSCPASVSIPHGTKSSRTARPK